MIGMAEVVEVARVEEFSRGAMRGVDHKGNKYIIANVDGTFYALEGICTHEYAEMIGGYLTGDQVLCPLHGSLFDGRTGEVLSPPATEPLLTFPTKLEGGKVYLIPEG